MAGYDSLTNPYSTQGFVYGGAPTNGYTGSLTSKSAANAAIQSTPGRGLDAAGAFGNAAQGWVRYFQGLRSPALRTMAQPSAPPGYGGSNGPVAPSSYGGTPQAPPGGGLKATPNMKADQPYDPIQDPVQEPTPTPTPYVPPQPPPSTPHPPLGPPAIPETGVTPKPSPAPPFHPTIPETGVTPKPSPTPSFHPTTPETGAPATPDQPQQMAPNQDMQGWSTQQQNFAWSNMSDQALHSSGWSDGDIANLRNWRNQYDTASRAGGQNWNQTGVPDMGTIGSLNSSAPNTPAAQDPTVSYLQSLLNPGFQQEQSDFLRKLASNASNTGAINSGAYQESQARGLADVMNTQQSQLAGYTFQGAQADKQRAMEEAIARINAQAQTDSASIHASASSEAAQIAATAQKYGVDQETARLMLQLPYQDKWAGYNFQLGEDQLGANSYNYYLSLLANSAYPPSGILPSLPSGGFF